MNFGLKFKEIRKAFSLTQKEFAERIDISRSSVAQIERGNNNPTTETILKIIEEFRVSPNHLFDNAVNIDDFEDKIPTRQGKSVSARINTFSFIKEHEFIIELYKIFCASFLILEKEHDTSIVRRISLEKLKEIEYLINENSLKLFKLAQKESFEDELMKRLTEGREVLLTSLFVTINTLFESVFQSEDDPDYFEAVDEFKKIT